ncbi:MAG: hypothetical protein HUU38_31625 [Anaerolineales bacterium]|nr:hypothetical protein [Anaerolineales bacterium]
MPSFHYDLAFLKAGIPELQAYLLSQEIYWPLSLVPPSGERPYPKMTLGWLILSLTRAEGWPSRTTTSDLLALRQQYQATRAQWRLAWQKKATQEFSARLKLWTHYLNEYRDDKINAHQYAYESQRRVLLTLLLSESTPPTPAEMELLQGMDKFLQAVLKPGPFLWEPELSAAFPPEPYWYLYGTLPDK